MLVTFLRHGQSEHNAGLTTFLDSRLTQLGELQSIATADRFVTEGVSPDNSLAFVSPFQRTLQTFTPTVERTHVPAQVFTAVCEYFSMRNDGYRCFEGLSPSTISDRFPWAKIESICGVNEIWWPQELETVDKLFERASNVRDQLIETYFDTDMQVIVVSHADPIGRMIEAFLRVEPNYERPPWSENCGITRLKISDLTGPAEVLLMNDVSHLEKQNLRSPVT